MKRVFHLFVVAFIVAVSISPGGCTSQDRFGGQEDARPQIALIMKSLANEFFKTMEDGAKAHQRENAGQYVLTANGIKDEQDYAAQTDLVDQMIGDKMDAVVIAPADSKALVTVCKRALDAELVVVNIDNKLDEDVLKQAGIEIPFVGPDNRAGAKKVGDYLAQHLTRGDKVAIIQGLETAFNSQQRRLGFEDAMQEAGMVVVQPVQSGEWETDKATTVASAILSEHEDLKAILCANDSMARGAVTAVKEVGRTGDVLIVGFDNISAIQELLKDGRVLATADQHGDQLAVYGIEFALQILAGESTPADKETPVDLITANDVR